MKLPSLVECRLLDRTPSRKPYVETLETVFPEPRFSGGQLTPAFENWGSMQIFEGQLGLTPSS